MIVYTLSYEKKTPLKERGAVLLFFHDFIIFKNADFIYFFYFDKNSLFIFDWIVYIFVDSKLKWL